MSLSGKLFGNKEMRLLMLGLDAAGKTSTYFTWVRLRVGTELFRSDPL
jgi:GTPase SAR1 family protein